MSLFGRKKNDIESDSNSTRMETLNSETAGSINDPAVSGENSIARSNEPEKKQTQAYRKKKITVHPDVLKLIWVANGKQKNYKDEKIDIIPIASDYAYIAYDENDFYLKDRHEPSLIYVDLPVNRSDSSVAFSERIVPYKDMTPKEKGAYWAFLEDPYGLGEKDHAPLNVFLCGVERHLFLGNHKQAIDTLVKLLVAYPDGIESFQAFATILLSCIYHKEKAIAESLLTRISEDLPKWKTFPFSKDIFLLSKYELGIPINATDIMHAAYAFDYKKRKYMKNDSERFESLVGERIKEQFGKESFMLSEIISAEDIEQCASWKTYSLFKNYSLASHTVVPYLTHNEKIINCFRGIIDSVHSQLETEERNQRSIDGPSNNLDLKAIEETNASDEQGQRRRLPFSELETAVLAYLYIRGKEADASYTEIATLASDYLRRLAQRQGKLIGQSFRNVKGLSYQLRVMEAAFTGTLWYGRPVPTGFSNIVEKYNEDPDGFYALVKEAYQIIGENLSENSEEKNETIPDSELVDSRINHISFVDWTNDPEADKGLTTPLYELYGISSNQLGEYDEDLTELDISNRLKNFLRRINQTTLGQILENNSESLMNARGVGAKSIGELFDTIKTLIEEHEQYMNDKAAGKTTSKNKSSVEKKDVSRFFTEDAPLYIQYGIKDDELGELKTNITSFNISVRLTNVLIREDLVELGDVLKLSPNQLRSLRNLGSKSYHELIDIVYQLVEKRKEPETEGITTQTTEEKLQHALQQIPRNRWSTKVSGYIKAFTKGDVNKRNTLIEGNENNTLEQFYQHVSASDDEGYLKLALDLLTWCSYDVKKEIDIIEKSAIKNNRQQQILYDRADGKALAEIGNDLGITRERVRQIEKKAVEKIHLGLEQHLTLLKIYAERNQDEVLTTTELAEYFEEKTPIFLYALRNSDGTDYIYDDNMDVFVVDNETLPSRVEAFLDNLPDILEVEEYERNRSAGISEHELNAELLDKALGETYTRSGSIFHRKKLSRKKVYELTVAQHYPNGIHVYDEKTMEEFRDHVLHDFGDFDLPDNNRAIVARIADCCILCDRGVYRPKKTNYISLDLLNSIDKYIQTQDSDIIPMSSVFHVFKRQLIDEGIDNRYYLQGVLHETIGNKYSFRRDYILKQNADTSFYLEMSEFINASEVPVTKEQLRRRFPGITDAVIVLATGDRDILNYFGAYYHASHLRNTEKEIEQIKALIDNALRINGRVNSRELYGQFTTVLEPWLSRNYVFNQFSLFTVLKYLYQDKYSFRRPYIAPIDSTLTEITLDDELTEVLDDAKFDEILNYCIANGINTVSDLVLERGIDELKDAGFDNETVSSLQSLFDEISYQSHESNIFDGLHPSLKGMDVSALHVYGVPGNAIEVLKTNAISELVDLENCNRQMITKLIGTENTEILTGLQPVFQKDVFELLENYLNNVENEPAYDMIINGFKQYGDGLRLKVYYLEPSDHIVVNSFLEQLSPFMDVIVSHFMSRKDCVTEQEILDIYDNDDYDQLLMYWCNHSGHLQYIDDGSFFVLADADIDDGDSNTEHEDSSVDTEDEELLNNIRSVLSQDYPKGFRLHSAIALRKFRRCYELLIGEPIDEDDERIAQLIEKGGICYEDMAYMPVNMADENTHNAIMQYIRDTFDDGTKGIYYDAIYNALSDQLLDSCIYSPEMLREYLSYMNEGFYYINKRYISQEAGYAFNTYDEIKRILLAEEEPITIEAVHQRLSNIPLQKVRYTLASNDDFISDGSERYFYVQKVSLAESDLSAIKKIIHQNIEERKFLSGTELLGLLKTNREELFEKNAVFSDLGIRNAIAYYLKDQFSFNGNIISDLSSSISMAEVFADFCKTHDRFTLSELNLLKSEMGSTIYFESVYDNSLRVSETEFVSKDQADFDVGETDKAIERFCTGAFVPIKAITQFGSFPKAGFEWNHYLLEHFVADYSEEFSLRHGSYNANKCVGAIVKRGAGITSFEEVLSRALANSDTELKKEAALQFFCDEGYIARRKYSGIEQVLIDAREIRNSKGL